MPPGFGQLEFRLEELRAISRVPGISVAFFKDGCHSAIAVGASSLETARGMTIDTRFEVSCMQKFFVALVTLDLAAKKVLNLSDNIVKHLPALNRGRMLGSHITIGHLLSHTSGYHGVDVSSLGNRLNSSWSKFLEFLIASESHHHSPGTLFHYEHTEHVILGEILGKLLRCPAPDFVQDRLLARIYEDGVSLSPTGSDIATDHIRKGPDGPFVSLKIPPFGTFWESSLPNWRMTPTELCNVAAILLALKSGSSLLAPEVLMPLRRPIIAIPNGISSSISEKLPSAFSMGGALFELGWIGHNGSGAGQSTALRVNFEQNASLVVSVNAWAPEVRDKALELTAEALNLTYPSGDNRKSDGNSFSTAALLGGLHLSELEGRYSGSFKGGVDVYRENRDICIQVGNSKAVEYRITLHEDNTCSMRGPHPITVAFTRDPSNGLSALYLGVHCYRRSSSMPRQSAQ